MLDEQLLRRSKHRGLSDRQIAALRPELAGEVGVRALRQRLGIHPVFKTVDTCAAEFEAKTPYHYSSYELDPAAETEVAPQAEKPKVLILGSGPNRIGQGIEFDYSCVHAATTLSEAGFETVMVNCNPETVSTDYDTADRLYFEPLTFEDVLEVYYAESASGAGGPGVVGVIVQLGGQTPLGLARTAREGRRADRRHQPEGHRPGRGPRRVRRGAAAPPGCRRRGSAWRPASSRPAGSPPTSATRCWCGRPTCSAAAAWRSSTTRRPCEGYITRATELSPEHPVLVDRFLEDAIEIDVDALCDGTEVYIGGIMEHIEEAGIHSGDSACALPPVTLGRSDIESVRRATEAIAHGIGVVGLLNVQYALKDDVLYVLEANPRASRTVPFVSKATAVPLAKACARIMLGATIAQLREEGVLAPTGDGGDHRPQRARRRQGGRAAVPPVPQGRRRADRLAAGPGDEVDRRGDGHRPRLRQRVRQEPDRRVRFAARRGHGVRLGGQPGQALTGVPGEAAGRLGIPGAGHRGHRGDAAAQRHSVRRGAQAFRTAGATAGRPCRRSTSIRAGEVDMVINTPYGNSGPRIDGYEIRSAAVAMNIPCVTTVQGASAAVQGIEAGIRGDIGVMSLQELHSALEPLGERVRASAGRRGVASAGRCAWASTRIPSCCARGACRSTPTG